MRAIMRGLVSVTADFRIEGVEEIPATGPLLVVMNHLGLFDGPVLLASFPRQLEGIVAAETFDVPVLGKLLDWYGFISVKRGQFDRQVVTRAKALLESGRALLISPEAGISETGSLRQARAGAAYLAVQAKALVLPVAITGTEKVHGLWDATTEKVRLRGAEYLAFWRSRRPKLEVRLTYGQPFNVEAVGKSWRERRRALGAVSDEMMGRIAELLPSRYQGVYVARESGKPS
jgi:1-acyl-sn-glycerol-3-phosphate acyltransferase